METFCLWTTINHTTINNDNNFCNSCVPKPQLKKDEGFLIDTLDASYSRIERHEAVMINSQELNSMSMRVLATLRNSNMLVIDRDPNLPLWDILQKLNKKISEDYFWQACSELRVIEVSKQTFNKMQDFISGKIIQQNNSRGQLLTKLYHKIEYLQKKIDSQENISFITKFLHD